VQQGYGRPGSSCCVEAVVTMLGCQVPRIELAPAGEPSLGLEAVELAASVGLRLDEWQRRVLVASLSRREDGRWAAFEVGLNVARQNGKGSILEARELAGLFLVPDERLIIHSAHQFDTSLEAYRRIRFLIEESDLCSRVKRFVNSHGEEGIELKDGKRLRFRTRTAGGGRGFSADLLMLDEAMILRTSSHSALLPTLSARPNPQVWYTGSAVDQFVHEHGLVFARIRERALEGEDARLAYFEWSADVESPGDVTADMAADLGLVCQANPAFGIRIDAEYVASERESLDRRGFAVERLGVGDYPATDGRAAAIDLAVWRQLVDHASLPQDPVCLAFDVSPERTAATIAAAGRNPDGLLHVELADSRDGVGWLTRRLADLNQRHSPAKVVCDGKGPAASLIHDLGQQGVTVETFEAQDYAQACGRLVDLVNQAELRHLGDPLLETAIRSAAQRPLGDAWAWSRKSSSANITPLVAATLALSAAHTTSGGYVVDLDDLMAAA
jgi:hypothetical protein